MSNPKYRSCVMASGESEIFSYLSYIGISDDKLSRHIPNLMKWFES